MFENPRRGRQASNFTTNVPKNSRSQIVFRTDIFPKIVVGCPCSTANSVKFSAIFLVAEAELVPRASRMRAEVQLFTCTRE